MKLSHTLLTAVLCAGGFSASYAQELRDWTDKGSGRKISASMTSADPAKRTVTIQTKEGQTYTLSVDRLVDADLLYIREQLTKPAATPAPAPAPAATPGAPPPAAPPAPAPAAAPVGAPAPPPPQIAVVPAKKFKFPTGTQILGAVKRERPRVFLNAAGLASLKARLASDPVSAALAKNVEKTSEVWLSKYPLQQKRGEGGGVGAEGLHRFLSFGIMDFLSGDPKWKDRMPSELEALAEFTNWKPDEGHDCAEFVFAVALGYDWFRTTLNEEKALKVRTALMQLGMDSLKAHLEHEVLPITTKRPEPGQTLEPNKAPPPKKKEDANLPKTSEEMVMASALLVAAIAIMDEESAVAAQAANAAAKVLGEGVTQFAPDGIWTEGLSRGEDVLDALSIVSMTLRSAAGSDYGMTTVEGLPQSQWARLLLNGPAGVFNYSSFEGNGFTMPWISTWLKMNHGNLGVPAFTVGAAASDQSGGLNQAGQLVFMSPYSTGMATPANFDYVIASAQVGAMRSKWHDSKAMFLGFKGGDNSLPGSQLDLGTFVLDAGGQRWAAELGTFSAQGRPLNLNDTKRFERYRDNTLGQNVLRFAGMPEEDKKDDKKKAPGAPDLPHNQSLDAKAPIVAFHSSPELGIAVVDLADAYSNRVRSYKRGFMLNRGPSPYVMVQDELEIKGTASPEWIMHTKAEVTASGKKATLKLGSNFLTATLLSPADAAFSTEIVPEPANTQSEGSFKGVSVLKIALKDLKGKHTISVAFAQGEAGVEVNVAPTEVWLPKKR